MAWQAAADRALVWFYSIRVESLARTSSMMNSEPSHEPGFAGLKIQNAGLIAEHDALGLRSGAAQRDGEPGMAGESPALRDRADKRGSQNVERFRGYDQYGSGRPPARGLEWDSSRGTSPRSTLQSLAAHGRSIQPGAIFPG